MGHHSHGVATLERPRRERDRCRQEAESAYLSCSAPDRTLHPSPHAPPLSSMHSIQRVNRTSRGECTRSWTDQTAAGGFCKNGRACRLSVCTALQCSEAKIVGLRFPSRRTSGTRL